MDIGTIIWIALIGGMLYFMLKGGGCCGGHSHGSKDHKEDGSDTSDKDGKEHKPEKGCH